MLHLLLHDHRGSLHNHGCSYVVVVEKDAIFQRLVEDGFAEQTGAILVTAKGMPDMATRAFLHSLCTALPALQQFAGAHDRMHIAVSQSMQRLAGALLFCSPCAVRCPRCS